MNHTLGLWTIVSHQSVINVVIVVYQTTMITMMYTVKSEETAAKGKCIITQQILENNLTQIQNVN